MRTRTASRPLALLLPVALVLGGCRKGGDSTGNVWTGSAVKKAVERGKFVVLTEATFHPFEYKDEKGELRGFDVDLARALAAEAGLGVEFVDREFSQLQGELDRGNGDFLISGMTITGQRQLTVSFTDPYFLTRTLTLLARPRADGVAKVDDLNDPARRIVAKLGTTGETATRARCPRARIDTLKDDALCALEVAQGRADAFIYDEMQVRRYAKDHPRAARVLEEVVTIEPYGIACRKGDVETVAWLNVVLDLLRRDGRIDALHRTHFPEIAAPK
jgi:polar amino acid transport system substrate-binding protein